MSGHSRWRVLAKLLCVGYYAPQNLPEILSSSRSGRGSKFVLESLQPISIRPSVKYDWIFLRIKRWATFVGTSLTHR